jgi:hypothetical protein
MIQSRIDIEFVKQRFESSDEYLKKEFQYRLESGRMTPKFKNLQELQKFINSLFDAETLLNTYGYEVSISEKA